MNILCDGQHEHAPWSINNGVFDTALEAEYTPVFAKALATAILESIAGEYKLPNVTQHAKKLKMSHFHSIAAEKQPARAMQMPTVPEFSYIIVIGNLPAHFTLPISDAELRTCICLQLQQQSFYVPCKSKLLRQTSKKGVSAVCSNFRWSRHQRYKHWQMLIGLARAIHALLSPVGSWSRHARFSS